MRRDGSYVRSRVMEMGVPGHLSRKRPKHGWKGKLKEDMQGKNLVEHLSKWEMELNGRD